jgi:hypothetical protein
MFDVLRELDNLGVDWKGMSRDGTPAELAARFGHLPVIQWLWIKGAVMVNPAVGWMDDHLERDGGVSTLRRQVRFGSRECCDELGR